MPINTSLLIAAPILQDYFVDKTTGAPLAGGIVKLFQDTSRTTLKNWYYQTGTPGNYSFIALDNPMTLSSVGTPQDPNGNDIIPFFYPYSESNDTIVQPYFIQIYSVNPDGSPALLQETRENFPFIPTGSGNGSAVPTLRNYIVNNEFWRNIGSITLTNLESAIIAPSQHDGFVAASDILFQKNATGATDVITFNKFVGNFPDNILINDITPEYYLNFQCSGTGSETTKNIQFPITLHVDTLSGTNNYSITLQAMNANAGGNNQITIGILQFLGTGVTSPPVSIVQTLNLTNTWQKYVISGIALPSAQNAILGGGGDDAFYLQIGLPVGANGVCSINIAKPSFYLSNQVPTNDFDTYDQINAIISSPRTGDYRTSLNSFVPFGWVACNNGTIGNASSNATARANIDTWPLYNLLWNKFTNTLSNSALYLPIFTSSGTPLSYGISAISDFAEGNQLTLTQQLGYVMSGTTPSQLPQTFTASGNILTLGTAMSFFTGVPMMFTTTGTLPGGLSTNVIYFAIQLSGTTISVATTYANALAGNAIGLSSSGTGTNTVTTGIAGTFFGETSHTLTIPEMPSHVHEYIVPFQGGSGGSPTGGVQTTIGSTGATGGSLAHNNMQPTIYTNVFLKL